MSKEAQREMRLHEYVEQLNPSHTARKEFEELIEVDRFMDALAAAGVDNWDGYEIAQESLNE